MTTERREHTGTDPCEKCGGGMCGLHPLGCIYGGFSCGYWMVAEGCELEHDEHHVKIPGEDRCPCRV